VKLTELEPRWILKDGERIGIVFRCPHCLGPDPALVTCYSKSPGGLGDQYRVLVDLIPDVEERCDVIPCKRDYSWTFVGDSFETLSITPSLDASASGHWHGHVTAGEIR